MQAPATPEITLALARCQVYDLLAEGLSYPGDSLLGSLQDGSFAAGLQEAVVALAEETAVASALDTLLDQTGPAEQQPGAADLAGEFHQLFEHGRQASCSPYETEYGLPHVFMKTQALADIAGFYRAFGLDASGRGRERPDHIGVQLEFMHYLAFKEARARARGEGERVEICLAAERRFVQDHLGRWLPLFAQEVARAAPQGFYARLAAFAAQFLAEEAGRLGVEPTPLPARPDQDRKAAEGLLEGCGGEDCQGCLA